MRSASIRQASLLGSGIQFGYTVITPILLVLISVRLVMTPAFLQFEYYRADFPEDTYGFTTEDRMQYAPRVLGYLLNGKDINYLVEMTFPDGEPLFNTRELIHMEDVKVVTRSAYLVLLGSLLITVSLGLAVWRVPHLRERVQMGLFQGAILTLSVIGAIVILSIVAWDLFFTGFHEIFFESGTWRFAYSDTLIRLFPERFWFDAALVIGVLTSLGAVGLIVITRPGRDFIRWVRGMFNR